MPSTNGRTKKLAGDSESIDAPPPIPWYTVWAPHLLSLLIPLVSLSFVWSGPHRWYVALAYVVPIGIVYWMERAMGEYRHSADPRLPDVPFDALPWASALIQFVSIYFLGVMYSQQSLLSLDLVMAVVVVGSASGFQIITAHELIHRKSVWERYLGRAVLCTVLYEHFYTEHLRGHHVRVGTPADPATARFGESFNAFYRRSVPAQFKSAWRLECKRLGDQEMGLFDLRQLRNRVLCGLVVQAALCTAMLVSFGPTALVAFALQGWTASRLLEVVNYFEHWGLMRTEKHVRPRDSWDTHARFTFYGFIGLSRHADHHAFATRPYHQLRVWEETPILPHGYIGMIFLVLAQNRKFRDLATEELRRKQLGPFQPQAQLLHSVSST